MSKPTPGPYAITVFEGILSDCYELKDKDGNLVAIFPIRYPETVRPAPAANDKGQAEANARAWVDGIAAMGLLVEIRQALAASIDASDAIAEIEAILTEAKP